MSTASEVCTVSAPLPDIDPDIDAQVERAMRALPFDDIDGRWILRDADDRDALARLIDLQEPAWVVHRRKVGLANGRHPIAWIIDGYLYLKCPSCRQKFEPRRSHLAWEPIRYECTCPCCVQDACSAEDGRMPPMGEGATREEAAQAWSDDL